MTDLSDPVLAIDIGGTKLAFAQVEGLRITDRQQIPTPRQGGGDALVAVIADQIKSRSAKSVAIATTGIVQDGRLTALNPVTLPIENLYSLAEKIEAATGIVPVVVNDAQAAAWGEYRFGVGQGLGSFLFVTASTGVGGGLVVDGNLLIGKQGLAGHVGHMGVAGPMRFCGCGRRGCLETIASGTAIAARYSEAKGAETRAPDVFAAALAGDGLANQFIDEAAAALAEAFANLTAAVDLDGIALGGGVGLAGGFLERVQSHCDRLPAVFRRPVQRATTGADAGMIGVADYWMKKNFIT